MGCGSSAPVAPATREEDDTSAKGSGDHRRSSIGQLRRDSLLRQPSQKLSENSSVYVKLCEQTSISFDKLMNSTEGCAALAKYAAAEHADENIRFWIAVQAFRRSANQATEVREASGSGDATDAAQAELEETIVTESRLEKLGASVIDTFLCADADSLVNLPSSMMAKYAQPSASGIYSYTSTMFDEQAHEIFHLIQKDTFSRFKCALWLIRS